MADEFNSSTNWWDRSRFDTGTEGSSSSSTSSSGLTSIGSFPWQAEIGDAKRRSSMESVSVSDSSGVDLNMMGLGLSSQAVDWNQTLLRGDKGENSFRSMLQENLSSSSNNYHQESGIRFSHINLKEQLNRGFSLDQPQFSPHGSSSDSTVTCQGLPTSFQIDSSAAVAAMYGSPPPMFQGLLGHENQAQHPSFDRPMDFPYGGSYAIGSSEQLSPPWPKVPQFFRNSPPKQAPHSCQVHFSNNDPFWNSSASTIHDVRPSFYPSLHPQFPTTNFEEKPKNISEVRDSNAIAKKSGSEISTKRPRNETASPLPAFKVKKEKMGDRITNLQQLVSPFGKTDTASVLSEAIEYIKFLHEQVNVLSTPYMNSGAPIHQHQSSENLQDPEGSQKQDLRSRGLCLVPISSTFPVPHETTVDFWTTFGGTFR